jgi:aminoglycoside phosphotransferase (APT) family kinase protein
VSAAQPLDLRLANYLAKLWGERVSVEGLSRIPGGASRETYRFDARRANGEVKPLILRRDPPGSLIDTDRKLEYLAFQSFHGRGVPVPEAVALEEGGAALDRPFFIMTRIPEGVAASPFTLDPYGEAARSIGEQFFTILGRIAAADPAELPIAAATEVPKPQACGKIALDHWEAVIREDALTPQPIVLAMIRRLRRNPPPPSARVSAVHGDYRTGNFLHHQGKITAVLDWEMAHIGDPHEDLGWAFDPLWRHFDMDRVGGMVSRRDAIAIWERASGLKVDPVALVWWEGFAAVKGAAIWISSAKEYRDGGGKDPVLGFTGVYCGRRQDEILADRLALMLQGEAA